MTGKADPEQRSRSATRGHRNGPEWDRAEGAGAPAHQQPPFQPGPAAKEAPPERPRHPARLSPPLTSLTGGNFFRHSRLRLRRSPCMFSSSFFTASGLLVPDMAPPGRPQASLWSKRAGAAPPASRPRPTRLRPTPEPVSRCPGPFHSAAPPPPRPPCSHNAGRRQRRASAASAHGAGAGGAAAAAAAAALAALAPAAAAASGRSGVCGSSADVPPQPRWASVQGRGTALGLRLRELASADEMPARRREIAVLAKSSWGGDW